MLSLNAIDIDKQEIRNAKGRIIIAQIVRVDGQQKRAVQLTNVGSNNTWSSSISLNTLQPGVYEVSFLASSDAWVDGHKYAACK